MRRRDFITVLGGADAWPLAARAQQGERVRRVGFLMPGDENSGNGRTYVSLLTQGLAELGWVEGRNLRIELRWAAGNVGRMQLFARELAQLRPDVIVVSSGAATKAVQAHTSTLPIIFLLPRAPL